MRESGYLCDTAGDADGARERLGAGSYELALLDVNMPGDSGIDLLTEIRREHPDVAVVMVTGEDSLELAMSAIELGAYGYLVKPVSQGVLTINIANALHRRRIEAQASRRLARMQDEAQALDASGIVGVRLEEKSHMWGSHTIEFLSLGTAVVKTTGEVTLPRPTTIISLDN